MNLTSARLKVFGHVQGVGFRYFCQRVARLYNMDGWVRNCHDGSVELRMQGDENFMLKCIDEMKVGPIGSVIKSINVEWVPIQEDLKEFHIQRSA